MGELPEKWHHVVAVMAQDFRWLRNAIHMGHALLPRKACA